MIPVFEPIIDKEEIESVLKALQRGEISGSFGESIPQFESKFAAYVGSKFGVAVSSGTAALQLAVRVAGIGPGDEVLVSASTNIASALGVFHNGAITVPVDAEDETWNLDLNLIEKLVTPKTKAIIPVHLLGHPVDMDQLMKIARAHELMVIEDCAEAHGAEVRGRRVGAYGEMACYSFYANKIITTGEGGMITTDDADLAEELKLLRNLAFTKPRFYHEKAGFNFRMTGLQAALGLAQLSKIDRFIEMKRNLAARYQSALKNILYLQLPAEKNWAKNVYWMYGVRVRKGFGVDRDSLMKHLFTKGVDTRTFFCSMSKQPALIGLLRAEPTPVADDLWESGFYLPSSCNLTDDEIGTVAEALSSYRP
jgi:perosamine synthetase